MAQTIPFHDNKTDTDYTLGFDRDSVRFAESLGVNVAVLTDARRVQSRDVPMATLMSQLFHAALVRDQPGITQEQSDDLWSRMPQKNDVFAALLDLAQEPYLALLGEAPDDPKESIVIKLPARK